MKKTKQIAPNVRVAELSGAARGTLAVIKKGRRFFAAGPKRGAGLREIPADYFTDAIHYEVGQMAKGLANRRKK